MYGFPLTIYFLSGWLTETYPEVNFFAHENGHLLHTFFGFQGDAHWDPFHIVSMVLIVAGFFMLSSAWNVLHHAQKHHQLATTGWYARCRHPQYVAFILIMFGFLLQWPTIPTLAMFPILVVVYVKLAKREEAQAIAEFGADRVGIVIGTSTSGISDAEPAIKTSVESGNLPESYHYSIQEMGNAAQFIAELSGAKGPIYAISTACSSGAKALASGKRLITAGICDVVIAGGVDTLCRLTVQGFSALEAVSPEVCNPFSKNRNGINIGEAAALFVLSRQQQGVILRGIGESSDAHHILSLIHI